MGEEPRTLGNAKRPKTDRPRIAIIVVVVEYYYFLIIIIVVGPGAWLAHSAAEGYRFLSNIVATLARNAALPIGALGGCCFLPPENSNSVQ